MARPNMDGFANRKELEAYRKETGGFRLGAIHPDHGAAGEVAITDDRHLFIVAGSRAGKGTTMIIPNLITWEGGLFCIDPKGENASITAMRRGKAELAEGTGTAVRQFLGQKVAILDPFGTVEGPAQVYRVSYDPLLDIEIGADDEVGQILAVAEAVVVAEKGSGSHFTESVETILAGLIEAVLHTETDASHHTLSYVREIVLRGSDAMRDYLQEAPATVAKLSDEAWTILESAGEDEFGSYNSTLSRQLKWLADPRVKKHLRRDESGFSLARAVRENWSIYVCVPPSRIPRMSRWLRAILRTALEAKMTDLHEHKGQQSLFMLDEFAALGHFQLIEEAAAYMAGYGIKLAPVIQNIGQVKKLYEKNWETFLGNAGAIIAWGLNDLETEQYVSDRMGPVIGWERSYGESQTVQPEALTGGPRNLSSNLSQRERAIRWPSEVHAQGARATMRAFIITADGAPFIAERKPYMDLDGQGLFDSPAHIRAWNRKHVE